MSPTTPLGPGREFDRIRSILAVLGPDADGVGDDCAPVPSGGGQLVASIDSSVEGVHFRLDWLALPEIGWRAAAAALSDLAAEGAVPAGALVSLAVPEAAAEHAPAAVMTGVRDLLREVGGRVLGGDLTRGGQWVVDVAVLGHAVRRVVRTGASAGDRLWVTGSLGGSRAALFAWNRGVEPEAEARAAFAAPRPRIAAGLALARAGATAMLDLSDGLGGDATHLAAASGVALVIELERVPLAAAVAREAAQAGVAPAAFGGMGGEDYELLVALPASFGTAEAERLTSETGVPLTEIGRVEQGSGAQFRFQGREERLTGYDHFR